MEVIEVKKQLQEVFYNSLQGSFIKLYDHQKLQV